MRSRGVLLLVAAAFGIAGCGGTKTVTKPVTPVSCLQALDAADSAFTAFADDIVQVKHAFDEAAAGHPAAGTAILRNVTPPDPSSYKTLEERCRNSK